MKKLLLLAAISFPLLSFAQFSVEWHSDSVKTAFQGDDIGFDYTVTNENTVDPMQVTWKFTRDTSGMNDIWNDYMCEGVAICWTNQTRQNTFTLDAGETLTMYHHIETFSPLDSGTWISHALLWVEGDSANTVHSMTVKLSTGIKAQHNGMTVYIMGSDTFEFVTGSGYVPLGIEDAKVKSQLGQNAPNPFQDFTTIQYELESGNGILKIHDLTGKLVQQVPLIKNSGSVTIDGSLESGLYLYSLWENGTMLESKRMQIIE